MTINLDTPFLYDPTKSLIMDIVQCGAPGASGFSTGYTTIAGSIRRNTSLLGASCPFPYGQQGGNANHTGLNITPVSGAPKNFALRLPTPGVNTNYVSIPHQPSMVGFQNITIEAWGENRGNNHRKYYLKLRCRLI